MLVSATGCLVVLLAFAAMRGLCAETVLIARACDFVFLAEGGG